MEFKSIAFRPDQIDKIARRAGEEGISGNEYVRRLVDKDKK